MCSSPRRRWPPPTPFFGGDEAEQAECATFVDFLNPRFELLSPQRSVVLPEDNFLGVDLVRLKPGQHAVIIEVTDVDDFTTTAVARFDVVPGAR